MKQRDYYRRDTVHQKAWVFWLILLSGVALSLLAFKFSQEWDRRTQQAIFQQQVDNVVATLNKELSINIEVLLGLNALFRSSQHVDRDEFYSYTHPILVRFDTIQALEWVPLVKGDKRLEHEKQARQEGLENYVIIQGSRAGTMVAADQRDEYFPVYYVEPLIGNEIVLGFDLATNSSRLEMMRESASSGQVRATAGIPLLQGDLGLLVAVPLYRGDKDSELLGFTIGVYRISEMVEKILASVNFDSTKSNITIWDVAGGKQVKQLFSITAEDTPADDRIYTELISVAGRQWQVSMSPSKLFFEERESLAHWIILAVGLCLSLLITQYVRILRFREAKVSYLVGQRTEELALSERTTNTVIDSALTAVVTIGKRGTVRRFNPAAEKMFGYTQQEVVGQNVKILMPEPYHSQHDRYLENYQKSGEAKIIGIGREVQGRRKDGSVFPVLLSVGEARVDSDPIYVGTLLDITLQKEAELALIRARNSAENANKQKSEFLNMMSHELRTPLTVILGYLPILQKIEALPPPEMIADIAKDIDASGQHLLVLINDLLDLSKIEAGSMKLNQKLIPACEVVGSVIDKLNNAAREKGLELLNQAGTELMFADPVRLQQILINLIGNAIKFTQQGSITISSSREHGFVELTVTDTGSGMAEEDLLVIFEKFRQLDSSSTRNRGGTGLGLAITERLVQLHGGIIRVTSTLGEGSCFSFTIPESGGNT